MRRNAWAESQTDATSAYRQGHFDGADGSALKGSMSGERRKKNEACLCPRHLDKSRR